MKTVLLVDESEAILETLFVYFHEHCHYYTVISNDIDKAIRLIKSMKFDLIICDCSINGRSCEEVAVAAREALPNAKLILMTTAGIQDRERLRDKFPNVKILSKPFDLDDLNS